MTVSRFQRLEDLFHQARRLEPNRRDAFLTEACGADAGLRDEVEALLAEYDHDDGFLAGPALREPLGLGSPAKVGPYTIVGPLGAGAMGEVYLAEQETPRRRVALKLLRPGPAALGLAKRFHHEAEVLARLHHPGIAQIYDTGVAEGRPYIAMELVEGQNLTDHVREQGVGVVDRLWLFVRICDAVQHAHQKGVVHRDLKPSNILVEGEGKAARPRILDFGVARVTGDDMRLTTMRTSAGEILGTLAYMSPEQVSGDPDRVDTRSDVYALGVILYELLSGRLPHDVSGRVIPEAARVIREEEPSSLAKFVPEHRGDLETIVAKALEKEPRRRYASAAEMAADVRRFLAHEPISARPASAYYQLSRFARRHRAIFVGASLAVLALLLGLAGTAWKWREANRAREDEADARARAERRFADLRDLARTFMFGFDDKIRMLPGALDARRLIVTTALKYLDGLATDAPDDMALLLELASAYARVGDIQGLSSRPNVGDPLGALRSYTKARELYERVIANGSDAVDPFDLVLIDARIGDVLTVLNRPDAALDAYSRARTVVERLRDDRGSTNALERHLELIEERVGGILLARGEWEPARQRFQNGLERTEQRLALDPNDDDARRDEAIAHFKIGVTYGAVRDYARARECYERYLGIVARRMEERPDDVIVLRDVSVGHQRLGEVALAVGDEDVAFASFQRAYEIDARRLEMDPDDVQASLDFIHDCVQLGQVHLSRGDLAPAESCFARGLDAARRVSERSPDRPTALRGLNVARYKMAELARRKAEDASLPSETRLENLRDAVDWFARSRDGFLDMKERGLLSEEDLGVPDEISDEIRACQVAILELDED